MAIVVTLMIYFIDPSLFGSLSYGFLNMLFMLAVLILLGFQARREHKDGFTYTQAFLTLLIIQSVAFVMANMFNYVLYNFIDPNLADFIKKTVIENTVNMMQSMGVKGEQLDEVASQIEKQDMSFGVKQLLTGTGMGISVGAVVSVIVGFVLKNRRG
jgi:predicted membrane protein